MSIRPPDAAREPSDSEPSDLCELELPTSESLMDIERLVVDSITAAAELLPRQGPITQFAFLNPLQGFEDEHFDDVMRRVAGLFGNEPYLDDQQYRDELGRGRIVESDLREVLCEELGARADESVGGLAPRIDIRLAMLIYPFHFGPRQELDWVLAETDALRRFRPEITAAERLDLIESNREWLLRNTVPDRTVTRADTRADARAGTGADRRADGGRTELAGMPPESPRRFGIWQDVGVDWEANYLQDLWDVIRGSMHHKPSKPPAPVANGNTGQPDRGPVGGVRNADAESRSPAPSSDPRVDELMIRFTSAFLDQGHASRPLIGVADGYWNSFSQLFSVPSRFAPRWRRSLPKRLEQIALARWTPTRVIIRSLLHLRVPTDGIADYLQDAMLSLRGFAGMIWQTEIRPDLFRKPSPAGTLIEWVAVRLLLLWLADEHPDDTLHPDGTLAPGDIAHRDDTGHPQGVRRKGAGAAESARQSRTASRDGSAGLSAALRPNDKKQRTFLLFELAQALRWTPQRLAELGEPEWRELHEELREFADHARRRVFHAAFERRIAKMSLHAIATHAASVSQRPPAPTLQLVCCIDAREESLRRHLEEIDSEVETFGIAGFFGVPMYYRGAGDAGFSSLCPIVIRPQRWVVEEAAYSLEDSDRTRAKARRWIGHAQRQFRSGSRGGVGGMIASTLVGPLATIPMLSRILVPRITARMSHTARQFVAPPTITRLQLERSPDASPGPPAFEGDHAGVGFTPDEMVEMSERALRDIGLTSRFAPLVILLGHGSRCINNPHESAYHCGACAGNSGGPNARALAVMLNDHRVRRGLASRGLEIPEETYFLAGQHNTATEEIMFFDQELLPTRKVDAVRAAQSRLAEAGRRNAQERCRRFESAGLEITPHTALLHVQNRSADLAQTRPEYGNGSNAICFVGRRQRIRGLFLDRRAFLMSYDPAADNADAAILARILGAVVPVCQGINALYSLSAIDPTGWGSGTKLPHNVTSLLGVMDGAASDLRPGLPWQGVEIHEPVRLLFVIEATPATMGKIMSDSPVVGRIFKNHWAHLATLDPDSGQMHRYSKHQFVPYLPAASDAPTGELPRADGSRAWYRGRREHLPFALTTPIRRGGDQANREGPSSSGPSGSSGPSEPQGSSDPSGSLSTPAGGTAGC